jgi:hypothetical protein
MKRVADTPAAVVLAALGGIVAGNLVWLAAGMIFLATTPALEMSTMTKRTSGIRHRPGAAGWRIARIGQLSVVPDYSHLFPDRTPDWLGERRPRRARGRRVPIMS